VLPARRPPLALGVLAALAAIALVTGLVYPLRQIAPVISLGVLYLLAVLAISTVWGIGLGVATAVGSALAFNVFHIPPTGTLTIQDEENWAALLVFLVTAVVAGSLAQAAQARAREADERRREADLAAELARVLLGTDDVESALPPAAQRIAAALGLDSAALVRSAPQPEPRRRVLPVGQGAWLVVPAATPEATIERLERAVVPTLEALLQATAAREALLHEVVETRALRRSEDVKTTLLRTVSHDLRTPLTAIAASAEALASPSMDQEERSEMAAGVAQQARDLSALVDDLLDLSRLEAGRAEPRRQWVALDEVLDAAIDGLSRDRVALRLDDDLPLLHADPAQLERAFHNLLENACRHSGGQDVTVRASTVGAKLVVRVTDRGPGVPEAEHERIFQPFYRAEADRPRSAGSGLGLAIVRGFVEGNGGDVHVESYPGQGASFVVRLPLVEGAR
jgi:two-component system sensor histidine kinase KdpD